MTEFENQFKRQTSFGNSSPRESNSHATDLTVSNDFLASIEIPSPTFSAQLKFVCF